MVLQIKIEDQQRSLKWKIKSMNEDLKEREERTNQLIRNAPEHSNKKQRRETIRYPIYGLASCH